LVNPLVECAPNFSEGRRPEIVEQIVDAIRSVRGATVLDMSSNPDHNRSVVTFVGPLSPVEEAAFLAIAKAAQLIDMEQHRGAHPRIGATDVLPLVPVRDVTLDECVAMARRLGERVGQELDVPVYLYEAAATRPDRQDLADVRRGEYEGLRTLIETDPGRTPDFGPSRMGRAGATVIGARPFLIVYNVYLNTPDAEVAKSIARTIRYSSGGYRFIKSQGFVVDGLAQVSVTFHNFTQTPLHLVQETIRREAQRYGVGIKFCEIIGMVPQAALIDSARWYLQLDRLDEQQILENRLWAAPSPITADAFVAAVAKASAAPGGGAAAALVGALAAALAEMVAGLAARKDAPAAEGDSMELAAQVVSTGYAPNGNASGNSWTGGAGGPARDLGARAGILRRRLLTAVDEDSVAVDGMICAYRLPGRTGEEVTARDATVQAALVRATEACSAVAGLSFAALQLAEEAARLDLRCAIGDAAAAAFMAQAAIETSFLNARINAIEIRDQRRVAAYLAQLRDIAARAPAILSRIRSLAEEGSGLSAL
jgi:glutamate formiminotransferase / formiminotetrahydrofolate cyclodeaminase